MTAAQAMRQENCINVLRFLRHGSRSRADLARVTGLTRAAITGIVEALLARGLIAEGEVARIGKGRHPTMLGLAPQAYHAVGLDIAREEIRLCILDFTMRSVLEHTWRATQSRESVLCEIKEIVCCASEKLRILGVGMVAPGPVDTVGGRILTPSGLEDWHHFCVRDLEQLLSLPVYLKKDASALAVAEKLHVGAQRSFLVLLADHGLGGGYIYNGRLFEPSGGLGCEIGHLSIDLNGPLCRCGHRGCAEMFASIPATLARAEEADLHVSWKELVSLARSGDERAVGILSAQADALADVCVNTVNILEPECIILEGELRVAAELFAERIERALFTRRFAQDGRRVRVETSQMPHHARAYAAANLVFENFFEGDGYDRFGTV